MFGELGDCSHYFPDNWETPPPCIGRQGSLKYVATGKADENLFVYLYALKISNSCITKRFAFIQNTWIGFFFAKCCSLFGMGSFSEVERHKGDAQQLPRVCKNLFCVCSEGGISAVLSPEAGGFFVSLFFCLFLMATPVAYGSSWARDWLRATGVTYATSFNPLHKAGDWTHMAPPQQLEPLQSDS